MGSRASVSLPPAIKPTRPPAPTASGLSPSSHHLPYPGHATTIDPKEPTAQGGTSDGEKLPKNLREAEAAAVALICCDSPAPVRRRVLTSLHPGVAPVRKSHPGAVSKKDLPHGG